MSDLVLWLDNLRLADLGKVGGKNSSLGEMIGNLAKLGVSVPGGFATTAHAFQQFIAQSGLADRVQQRLAGLMGTEIRVTSALGLGSSFSLELPLQVASGPPASPPDLSNISVYVRSPHHELSDNICQWLKRWGAQAVPAPQILPAGGPDDVLVDVLYPGNFDAMEWTGHHVLASATATLVSGGKHEQSESRKSIPS